MARSSANRLPPHGGGHAHELGEDSHAGGVQAVHLDLAQAALDQLLAQVEPLVAGDRVGRAGHVQLGGLEQVGAVPEHGVLGVVLGHAVARARALLLAVVAPHVVDRVEVGGLQHRTLGEVRVQVSHQVAGGEVRGLGRAEAADDVRRVLGGEHGVELGGVPDDDVEVHPQRLFGGLEALLVPLVLDRHHGERRLAAP